MISNNWFFQTLKSEALEGTGPNVAYRSKRSSTMSLSTRSLWLVKFWGMRSRTNSSTSSSKPISAIIWWKPLPPDLASAGKERGLGGRPEGGNGKDTAALLWLWTWSTWISWASSTADIRVERSCEAPIMDSNCAEKAGGGGASDLTWSTGWAALRAAKLISISWQRWRRDKFWVWDSSKAKRWESTESFSWCISSISREILPSLWSNMLAEHSTLLPKSWFRVIWSSNWAQTLATSEFNWWIWFWNPWFDSWRLSTTPINSWICESAWLYTSWARHSNPLILSSYSWTTLLASETMLAKSMGSTPTFTCWVRWSWYWTVCEWCILASGWPLGSWGMKVEGWEADAELCARGTGNMARSLSDGFGKRLIT